MWCSNRSPACTLNLFDFCLLDLRKAFVNFDTNSDGTLSREELTDLIKKVVAKISEHEIETLLNKLDKNGDNKIDFEGI